MEVLFYPSSHSFFLILSGIVIVMARDPAPILDHEASLRMETTC